MSWESMLPMAVISAMIFVMANSQDVINKFTTGKVCVLFFACLSSLCWWSFHCQIFLNMFDYFIRFSLCVFFLCLCLPVISVYVRASSQTWMLQI
jgi:hypothetical protein